MLLLGAWLPELQRWCVAYKPNDLMMVKMNTEIEHFNEDVKYDELVKYENCTFSDLLNAVIDRFIPKL